MTRLLILALMLMCTTLSADTKADFYVAPNGSDRWSGVLPVPSSRGTDGPFATVDRARLAVRELRRRGSLHRPVTVLIRAGTYYLDDTLIFTSEDSGTADSPTVYAAYPGESPVISGGRRLTGWTTDSHGWWHLSLPEVKEGKWSFISLYADGERRYRPRLPREGCYRVAAPVTPVNPDGKPDGFRFVGDEIRADWANLGDVEVLSTHLWNMSRMRVKSVDDGVVRFTGTTYANANFGEYAPGQPFFVENVREALGRPGDWYLDRLTGELIYIPKRGESPKKTEIVVPRLDLLVRLAGDWKNGRYASHIILRGLTFAHSNWCTPPRGFHFPQSDAVMPGAIPADGVRFCRFDGCRIEHTGAYAIQLGDSCKYNTIEGCELTDLGAGGIKIGFWAPMEPEDAETSHNFVRDNLIAHGGRIQPGGTGVIVGNSHHNRIERNDIFDLYYIGVSLGYTWELNTTAHHNVVQDNHIHDIGQGTLSDMGAIYTLGLSPGTVIRHNLIHDVHSQVYGGWGIYLDALSSEITVGDNIVHNTDGGGFHHNRGQNNRVRNNIFALGLDSQLTRSQGGEKSSFDFERNIIYWDGGALLGSNWEDYGYRIDRNLYWDASGRRITFAGLSLGEWQAKGLDRHSVVADPLFADPGKGDFRLADGSPALELGFKRIDPTGFGRRSSEAVPLDKGDRRAAPRVSEPPPAPPYQGGELRSQSHRAFPDLSVPEPIDRGFEDTPVGGKPPYALFSEENDTAVVRVTDEDALTGKQCLRFTDADGQKQPYNPHLIYNCIRSDGVVVERFAIKVKSGAHFWHEWRDASRQDRPGPSIHVDGEGSLTANGRALGKLPLDAWVRLEIRCGVGRRSTREYSLRVQVDGDRRIETYTGIPCHPEFRKLMMLLFVANGDGPGVFYVDDLSVRVEGVDMGVTLSKLSKDWLELSRDYRPSAFWFWNADMDTDTMRRRVEEMARADIREVLIHPIHGLTVEYLSDAFFEKVRCAFGLLKSNGIKAWVYDEYGWPSGNAGGKLLSKHPEAKGWILEFSRDASGNVTAAPKQYDRILDNSIGAPWTHSEAGYLDTLSESAVRRYIELTYNRYLDQCGEYFGDTILGFFTDEPVTMMDPLSERWGLWGTIGLPWTPDLPARFKARFGYDIEPLYPQLAGDGPSKAKEDYWTLAKELHIGSYHRQISDWCHAHGVRYTGHLGEDLPLQQVRFAGSAYQALSCMDVPGVDFLGHMAPPDDRWAEFALVPSVARHNGRDRVYCEAYGIAHLDIRLGDMLRAAEMLGIYGINDIALMGFHQGLDGIRKHMYWPPLFVESPWWPFFPAYRDALARSVALTNLGMRKARYAVLYPQYELEQTDLFRFDPGATEGNPGGEMIRRLGEAIYFAGETFDFVFPEMLDQAGVEGGRIVLPNAEYDALLVPGDIRFFEGDAVRLKSLSEAGGRVITDDLDSMCESIRADKPLWSDRVSIASDKPLRINRFEYPDGELFTLRNSGDEPVEVTATSDRVVTLWDPHTGDVFACPDGIKARMARHDTIYFTLTDSTLTARIAPTYTPKPMDAAWAIALERPNTVRLSDVMFRHPEKGWLSAVDQTIFNHLKGKLAGIPHDFAGHTAIEFKGEFRCDSVPDTLGILFEREHLASLSVNGKAVDLHGAEGHPYWDASCMYVDVRSLAAEGANTVTGVLRYEPFETTIRNHVVYMWGPMPTCDVFPAGSFTLKDGAIARVGDDLSALPLDFGRAGYGEYAGILKLSADVDVPASARAIEIHPIAEDGIETLIDGKSLGMRVKPPYRFAVEPLTPGKHRLEVRVSSTSANLFANLSPWGTKSVEWLEGGMD